MYIVVYICQIHKMIKMLKYPTYLPKVQQNQSNVYFNEILV